MRRRLNGITIVLVNLFSLHFSSSNTGVRTYRANSARVRRFEAIRAEFRCNRKTKSGFEA